MPWPAVYSSCSSFLMSRRRLCLGETEIHHSAAKAYEDESVSGFCMRVQHESEDSLRAALMSAWHRAHHHRSTTRVVQTSVGGHWYDTRVKDCSGPGKGNPSDSNHSNVLTN